MDTTKDTKALQVTNDSDIPTSDNTHTIPQQKTSKTNTKELRRVKLTDAELYQLCYDWTNGAKTSVIASNFGISEQTVLNYLKRFNEIREQVKSELGAKYLQLSTRAINRITDDKLDSATALQLITIARESIYAGQMLEAKQLKGSGNVNLTQIIIESQNALKKIGTQNTKVIDIPMEKEK